MGAVTLKLNNHDSGKHHLHHCKTNGSLAFFYFIYLFFYKYLRWYCAP